jgi:hypothetical protein
MNRAESQCSYGVYFICKIPSVASEEVKLSLCLTKCYVMKTHGGLGIQIHDFLPSAVVWSKWWASLHVSLTLRKGAPVTNWIGDRMGPIASLTDTEKWTFLSVPGLELQPLGRPARRQSLYRLLCRCCPLWYVIVPKRFSSDICECRGRGYQRCRSALKVEITALFEMLVHDTTDTADTASPTDATGCRYYRHCRLCRQSRHIYCKPYRRCRLQILQTLQTAQTHILQTLNTLQTLHTLQTGRNFEPFGGVQNNRLFLRTVFGQTHVTWSESRWHNARS